MQILLIVSGVLMLCLILYCAWVVFFALTGLFLKRRPWPSTETCLRMAVMICARNEEKVIVNLIDSLKKQHYPERLFDVFVVAHNCSDQTAAVAEAAGATIFVLNDPDQAYKGAALNFGLKTVQEMPDASYDAFVVFDADNLAEADFLWEINKALCAGADVAQGFRASKNYDDNLLTRLFGGMWMGMAYVQNIPHSYFKLPVIINGTGFAARFSVLPDEGWNTMTLCEDIEFSVQQMLAGHRIATASKAVFYDEQTGRVKAAFHQRLRWAVGINQCFCRYIRPVIKAIPKYGIQAFKIAMDLCLNPMLIAGAIGLVCQTVLLFFNGASIQTILMVLGVEALVGWLMILPMTLNLIIKEKMPLRENLGMIILMPAFLFLSGILALAAPFCMNSVKWIPIAHVSDKKVEEMALKR